MWRRPGAFGLIAVLVAMAGVFACRQIVGFSESSPEGTSPDASPEASTAAVCGLPYGTGACAACVHTNCCTESTACASDPGCATYEGCLGACSGDPACRSRCGTDQGYTASEVPALGACLASKCETPCGLPCGAMGSVLSTSPDGAAACQSCFAAGAACQAGMSCAASAECTAYDICVGACPTTDCQEACASTFDAGAPLFVPVAQAFVGSCASPCGVGRDWSCVGHVNWPVAQLKTVSMTVAVEDSTVSPVPGAEVAVSQYCPPSSAGAPVLADGSTDDAGTVTLQVAQSTNTGAGFDHGLDGCIVATAPGYLQTFWYWGFPLTEPAVTWTPTLAGVPGRYWIPLITPANAVALNTTAGSTLDPSRGIVGVTFLDCESGAPAGVQITPDNHDPAIRILYGDPPARRRRCPTRPRSRSWSTCPRGR